MHEDNIRKEGKYQFNMSWILYVPIIIILGIIPLLMRLTIVRVEDTMYGSIFGGNTATDIFSQFKAGGIILISGAILVICFLCYNRSKIKIDKYYKIYLIGVVLLAATTILSTVRSEHKQIAWWGVPDRAEGAVILCAYLIIMLYALYLARDYTKFKYVIAPLIVLCAIQVTLGIFQYIGYDLLLKTDIGKSIIIPEKYSQYRDGLKGLYDAGRMYGTLFHYNYVGSFAAMMIPLFGVLCLTTYNRKNKILLAVGTLLGGILLLGSTSRAGIIGLILSIIAGIIIYYREIVRRWKMALGLVLVIGVGLVCGNVVTQGTLFERIPNLVQDAVAIFNPSDSGIDYKQEIPISDISSDGKKLVVTTPRDELQVTYNTESSEEILSFTDKEQQPVQVQYDQEQYVVQDPRFQGFTIRKIGGEMWLLRVNNEDVFKFINSEEGLRYIDPYTYQVGEYEEAPYIGFKGKEKIGSSRGYIWSRSLPLLKDTWLIGSGPDTFVLEFPHNDTLAKWYAYGTTNMTVDKPHNLYLQIAINQGGLALLGFILMIGTYTAQSVSLYMKKRIRTDKAVIGIAIFLAIVGYLGAGIFNDSVVSVAPIFWVLLGSGFGINLLIADEHKKFSKSLPHATIDIQSKKHI